MSIHEECGVFGVFSKKKINASDLTYYGLFSLQHRGQESCGIVVNDDGLFVSHKDLGLVTEVMTKDVMQKFPLGKMAVGHCRYGTTGGNDRANCQPIEVNHKKGRLAIAHNGNISNAILIRDKLEEDGAIFHTTSDTETIAYLVTRHRLESSSIEEAILKSVEELEGAFSICFMSPTKLIAVRDPHGFRPLCYGTFENDGEEVYVVSSESCALEAVGAKFVRDIKPGEMVVFSNDGVKSYEDLCGSKEISSCIFENIYFARPDSVIDGLSVHESRYKAGRILAKEFPAQADLVVGVPDSGLDAALGYAHESSIPYGIGLIKNKYIGRTFIAPASDGRSRLVRMKLAPVESAIKGKSIVLIDDSIVRGTTSKEIIDMLRQAGASQIHMRISAPPFLNPCYYGTDIDSRDNLIAVSHTVEGICQIIGADSLGFLPVESLPQLTGAKGICAACFTGQYPTPIHDGNRKDRFDKRLSEKE